MRKVVLLCLLVFSIALHAQEHSENNTMENLRKSIARTTPWKTPSKMGLK